MEQKSERLGIAKTFSKKPTFQLEKLQHVLDAFMGISLRT